MNSFPAVVANFLPHNQATQIRSNRTAEMMHYYVGIFTHPLYPPAPMIEQLIAIVLPVSLILVMTGVGLSLQIKDFRRVANVPKAFFIGALCQLILLPLLAIGVISVFQLSGAIAIGLLIISLCPGGVTSNLFTYLAKGDVGLSVSLTAVIGFITPFTIPLILTWGLDWQAIDNTSFNLPVGKTIATLFLISVLPVLIGMVIKHYLKDKTLKAEPWVRAISSAVLALVIIALYFELGASTVNQYARLTGIPCIVLNLAGMALGLLLASLSKLNVAQRTCITMEVGLQNGTIALLITREILKSPEMSIAPCIYSLWMMVPATLTVILVKKIRRKRAASNLSQA